MWVVKIGGSLAYSELLPAWLDTLACYGGGNTIVVPGGGAFAEQVRDVHTHWGFDDRVAHRMAIMAMEQYGLMLLGLRPDLVPVATTEEIYRAWERSSVPVWLPRQMLLSASDVPASWDVTSDSLSAWLAYKLGAQRLVLVKAISFTQSVVAYDFLVEHGIVDPAFGDFSRKGQFKTWLCGPEDATALQQGLYGDAPCRTLMLMEPLETPAKRSGARFESSLSETQSAFGKQRPVG